MRKKVDPIQWVESHYLSGDIGGFSEMRGNYLITPEGQFIQLKPETPASALIHAITGSEDPETVEMYRSINTPIKLLVGRFNDILPTNPIASKMVGSLVGGPVVIFGRKPFSPQRIARNIAKLRKEIENGGLDFKCNECGTHGVIRAKSELAKRLRQDTGIAPPLPLGIIFKKCSDHSGLQVQ